MQAVCILLWTDCFETFMVVTYPLDLCCHEKKPVNFSFDNMRPLKRNYPVSDRHFKEHNIQSIV